jgi:hypothetical protein
MPNSKSTLPTRRVTQCSCGKIIIGKPFRGAALVTMVKSTKPCQHKN